MISDEKLEPLSWDLRAQIALDVARGLEYLHDGVSFNPFCNDLLRVSNSFACLVTSITSTTLSLFPHHLRDFFFFCLLSLGSPSCDSPGYQIIQHFVRPVNEGQGTQFFICLVALILPLEKNSKDWKIYCALLLIVF